MYRDGEITHYGNEMTTGVRRILCSFLKNIPVNFVENKEKSTYYYHNGHRKGFSVSGQIQE